jgi:hypothetical protein
MRAGRQDEDDRVFTLATGAPASPDLLTRAFDDAMTGAKPGLPRITLHGDAHISVNASSMKQFACTDTIPAAWLISALCSNGD